LKNLLVQTLIFGEIQNVHCQMFWKPNGIVVDHCFDLVLVVSNLIDGVLGIMGIFHLDLLFFELLGAIHGDINN
jgi:hypothetical protein